MYVCRQRRRSIILFSNSRSLARQRAMTAARESEMQNLDLHPETSNLSSAIRLFVLDYFRTRAISMMFIGERQTAASTLAPVRAE